MPDYDAFADVYDIFTSSPFADATLPFYVDEYVRTPGSVVELGVGSGRIAIEAAQRGKPILGVDSAAKMLAVCRRRAEEVGVSALLTLMQADFRDFTLPEPAALITIPYQTIGYLITIEDKRAALRHIRTQLAPGGRLLFDHFIFSPELAYKLDNTPYLEAEYTDEATGRDTLVWGMSIYNFEEQTIRGITWTEELDSQGIVLHRRYRRLWNSWIEPPQMEALLLETGYEIEALYGDFDRTPLDAESGTQIWVAKNPE